MVVSPVKGKAQVVTSMLPTDCVRDLRLFSLAEALPAACHDSNDSKSITVMWAVGMRKVAPLRGETNMQDTRHRVLINPHV